MNKTLLILFLIVTIPSVGNSFSCQYEINKTKDSTKTIIVAKNIEVKSYFQYLDSIVKDHNSIHSYKITEHILVRYNPRIIDALANTDYYRMMERDSFVYNQKELVVLKEGSKINIPDSLVVNVLVDAFNKTRIDVNIPEYKLRIYEDSLLLYEFPIRVGRDEKKYLKMSGRIQDLKTKTGDGEIVAYVRNPDYYNPATGKQYFLTNRDDKKVTKLPQIPFIETEINKIRYGQLIHPTTNQETLGKAYSNGCIGMKEADSWILYYYAPIGTKIKIRYDLNVLDVDGNPIVLKDIYNRLN